MNGTQTDSEQAYPAAAESTDASAGTGRIVVGADDSVASLAALNWAVQQARHRGGSVHAVMAWQRPQAYGAANVWGVGMDPSFDAEALAASAATEAARLGERATHIPDVAITTEAIEGHPAEVLLGAAEDADLLVVGSRGHGGFVGALLGSVSRHVVAHSPCPVVVVPDPQHGASRTGADGRARDHA